MITPFEVYLIFQLDALRSTLEAFAVVFGMGIIPFTVLACIGHAENQPNMFLWGRRLIAVCVVICLGSITLRGVLPTSKSMAAIVILPAVVNNEAVQVEAREIYNLAKEGLRTLVTPDEAPPSKE